MHLEPPQSLASSLATPTPGDPWLIPHLLPARQLIFLDGPPAVGKSLLAAAWAAQISRAPTPTPDPQVSLLWLAHHEELAVAGPALLRHGCQADRVRCVPVRHTTPHHLADPDALSNLHTQLFELQAMHSPRLIIIDGLEKHFPILSTIPSQKLSEILEELHWLAIIGECSILLLRSQGIHVGRQSGSLARLGAHYSHFGFTLAWHPHDTRQRILTIVKNHHGPTGIQFHVTINDDQLLSWQPVPDQLHAKPGLSLLPPPCRPPRLPRPSHLPELLQKIAQLVQPKPIPAKTVRLHLLEQGYSKKSIRKALARANIVCQRSGNTWIYLLRAKAHTKKLSRKKPSRPPRARQGTSRQHELKTAPTPTISGTFTHEPSGIPSCPPGDKKTT